MTQIQVDQSMQEKLGGMTAHVALCNTAGQVLGHYLPDAEYNKLLYASYKCDISEEELARRATETGGCTLDEIWNRLGVK